MVLLKIAAKAQPDNTQRQTRASGETLAPDFALFRSRCVRTGKICFVLESL